MPFLVVFYCFSGLVTGNSINFYNEIITQIEQIFFIGIIYTLLTFGSWNYSKGKFIKEGG